PFVYHCRRAAPWGIHAMADKRFHELGAQIILHEADAEAVEKGTQVTAFYLVKGLAAFPRSPVARRLSDGEELELGSQKIRVIHTPGHTPGSVCFLLEVDGKNLLFPAIRSCTMGVWDGRGIPMQTTEVTSRLCGSW